MLAFRPFHSSVDGDVLFVAATGKTRPGRTESRPGELADRLGTGASELAVEAVLTAIRTANPPT
jgi:L-aminopeptidase/D-esterase-like protein